MLRKQLHLLNTLLLMSDVAEKKVQSVTGHLTTEMTEHYTHFDTRQFTEIRNVQAGLLTFKEPETVVGVPDEDQPMKKQEGKQPKKTADKKKAIA